MIGVQSRWRRKYRSINRYIDRIQTIIPRHIKQRPPPGIGIDHAGKFGAFMRQNRSRVPFPNQAKPRDQQPHITAPICHGTNS